MFISFQRKILSLFAVFTLLLSLPFSCGEKGSQPVARVGGRIITVREFEDAFSRGKSEKILAESTFEKKLEHLNKMIDNELQIVAAYRENLDKDEEIIKKVEQRGENTILRRLIDKEIIDPNITKSEIKKFYNMSKKQVKISEIVIKMKANPSEQEKKAIEDKCNEIMTEIKKETDFSKLVEKYSEDKNKRVSPQQSQKGLLKYTPVTADDPVYQKAFSMKVNDISEPIKTNRGYSIIKVDEIIKQEIKPFSVEESRIKQQILRKKGKELEKKYFEFLEKLKEKYGAEFNEENIQKFMERVNEAANDTTQKSKSHLPRDRKNPFQNFSVEDKKLPLVIYEGGEITIENFIELLNRVPITRRPNIQDKENVINLLERNVLPHQLLKLEAEAQNIRNDDKVKEEFTAFSESYMLNKIKQMEVKDKVNVTDDDLKKYFEKHREEYKNQEKREIQEIYVKDETLANELAMRARSGENFTKLVKKYNEKAATKNKDGNLGFITRSRKNYGKSAFETEVGGIAGPIKIGRNYHSIIKVLSIEEESYKTFEESRRSLSAKLNREFNEKRQKEWMDELRTEIEVTIYERRLENTFSNYKTD